MLPFRKQNESNMWKSPANFQNEYSFTDENYGNGNSFPVGNFEQHPQSLQERANNNRSVMGRVNSTTSLATRGNWNDMRSTFDMSYINQPTSSTYQVPADMQNSFVSPWRKQQMPMNMTSMSVVQASFKDQQQTKPFPIMSMGNERSVPERQMERSGFKYASLPTFSSAEKTNTKQESKVPKDSPDVSCHLVGSVEQVLRWYQSVKSANISVIFQVHGNLESIRKKDKDITILMIKHGKVGPSIQGVFCAIDRPFMKDLKPGDNIVCIGSMKGAKKMQIFTAWRETGKREDYNRIFFLCQRALQEKILANTGL